MHNPHLGLINAAPPPYLFVFFQTTFFTIHLLSKRPDICKMMAKTLLIIFPPSWGDPFARINMGLVYNKCYLNSNDLGVIIFQNLLVLLLPGMCFCVY